MPEAGGGQSWRGATHGTGRILQGGLAVRALLRMARGGMEWVANRAWRTETDLLMLF